MLEFNNITGTERVNPEYRQEQQKKKPEICCKIKIRLKKHRSHCLFYQWNKVTPRQLVITKLKTSTGCLRT